MSTANLGLYLYRHVQTNQVLVSLRQNMKNKALNQLGPNRTPVLRKDLWRPLVALTGFDTFQSAQALNDALLQRSEVRQNQLKTSSEHVARPKRLRKVDEQNMVENSILSLREALESVSKKQNLLALWEQPRFMEMKGEKEWPSSLKHGQLELRNNRFVKETQK
ncbi:hypothetical protein BY458DRAFT_524777 [Sporodiniella umbellata]|nr:hypothetical protein BY458DRAFT_524777 [Sporodiniella umbellata]